MRLSDHTTLVKHKNEQSVTWEQKKCANKKKKPKNLSEREQKRKQQKNKNAQSKKTNSKIKSIEV